MKQHHSITARTTGTAFAIVVGVAATIHVALGAATAPTTRSAAPTTRATKAHKIVYFICGTVAKAGEYSTAASSLKEAVTKAEPSEPAKYVRLIRSEQGKPESAYDVGVDQLSNEPDADRPLIQDDQILVSDSPFPDLDPNQQEVVDKPKEQIDGEYYLGGHVERTGVYSLTGRRVTLRQAVMIAGGPEDLGKFVKVVRKSGGGFITSMKDVFLPGSTHNPYLQPDDQIMVMRDAPQPAH